MLTWQHGFWIYFITRNSRSVWQYVVGSMLPDYIYIVLLGMMLVNGQIGWNNIFSLNPRVFMSFLPLYPWAVQVDLLGHSVVVWGVAFALALLPGLRRMIPLIIGWGTHLLLDGLTHGAHANYFLYPLSMRAVHSPISYWEPQFFAYEFKLVNGVLMAVSVIYLVYSWWSRKYRT